MINWWGVNYLQYILKANRDQQNMNKTWLDTVVIQSRFFCHRPFWYSIRTCFALTIAMTYLLCRRHNLNSHWTMSETSKKQWQSKRNKKEEEEVYKRHGNYTICCLKECSFICLIDAIGGHYVMLNSQYICWNIHHISITWMLKVCVHVRHTVVLSCQNSCSSSSAAILILLFL